MKLIRDLAALPAELRSGAMAIGNFDGVHRGHARIVERLVSHARAVDGPAIVLTFDPHPVRILRPDAAPPPLTWTDRKAQLLAELGVDSTVVLATDGRFADGVSVARRQPVQRNDKQQQITARSV